MPHLPAVRRGHDPVGVSLVNIVVARMGVGTRDDDHAARTAASGQIAESIHVAKPLAAIVERHLGGIVRDGTTGVEGDRLDAAALEVGEPEVGVVVAGVVFGETDLRPAHGFRVPGVHGRADVPGALPRKAPRQTFGC